MSAFERLPRIAHAVFQRLAVALKTPRARRTLAAGVPDAGTRVPFVVYFADVPSSAYQLRQWLPPLEALDAADGPVALLVRNPEVALALSSQTRLAVVFATDSATIEQFVSSHDVHLVFYVNNSQSNFTTLRINGPVHVHLSHGESEKSSMYSNQLKAYDYAFVAGDASAERILANVRGIDPTHLVRVGRPQLALPESTDLRPPAADTRHTVLYAPTWEGDGPRMAYGSLVTHGEQLVESLLADPRVRLVFRPHPKSGSHSSQYGLALARIKRRLATTASRAAGHELDRRINAVESISRADVVVADVSAMAMDALGLDRPLVLCTRAGLETGPLASHVATWAEETPADAAERLVELAGNPVSEDQARYRKHVFATGTPAEAVSLFVEAAVRAAQRGVGGTS